MTRIYLHRAGRHPQNVRTTRRYTYLIWMHEMISLGANPRERPSLTLDMRTASPKWPGLGNTAS